MFVTDQGSHDTGGQVSGLGDREHGAQYVMRSLSEHCLRPLGKNGGHHHRAQEVSFCLAGHVLELLGEDEGRQHGAYNFPTNLR